MNQQETINTIILGLTPDIAQALNEAYQSGVDDQRRKWASLVNSLACIIIDGEISSNDLNLANDAVAEVGPYLEPDF